MNKQPEPDMRAFIREYYEDTKRRNGFSKANRLAITNRMRAQSGDRPLTMAEFDQIHENVKNGIFVYQQYLPKTFSQRLRIAVRRSWQEFMSAMRK